MVVYLINCFNTNYIFNEQEIKKSGLLSYLVENIEIEENNGNNGNNENNEIFLNDFSKIFNDSSQKQYWDWVYNEIKTLRENNYVYYNYKDILYTIPYINYFDISYIIDNIAIMINKGFIKAFDIIENYNLIYNNVYIRKISHLFLLSKFLSIDKITNYIFDFPLFLDNTRINRNKKEKKLKDKYNYLKNLEIDIFDTAQIFSTSDLENSLKIQKDLLGSKIPNFILFYLPENNVIKSSIEVPKLTFGIKYDKSWTKFYQEFKYKSLKNIIPPEIIEDDEFGTDFFAFCIVLIDFSTLNEKNLIGLSYFDPLTYVYEFIDPFSKIKYLLFSNTFIVNSQNKFLIFDNELHNGLFPTTSNVNRSFPNLVPLMTISDFSKKRIVYYNNDVILTIPNKSIYVSNIKNDFLVENIYSIIHR